MQVSCPQCDFAAQVDGGLLPPGGMEGRCPRCRATIPLGAWQGYEGAGELAPPKEEPEQQVVAELPPEGRVSVINLMALLFLLDSVLSLFKQVPLLMQLMAGSTAWDLHFLKNLYDTAMALAFFVTAFGLSSRKEWARIAMIVLLSLGLFEGLCLFIDQHLALSALEKGLGETLPDQHRMEWGRALGLALYVFFLLKLNSNKIKARFR